MLRTRYVATNMQEKLLHVSHSIWMIHDCHKLVCMSNTEYGPKVVCVEQKSRVVPGQIGCMVKGFVWSIFYIYFIPSNKNELHRITSQRITPN